MNHQSKNSHSELILTISHKPKTSCFPMFTGDLIRLETKEDLGHHIEKYIKVEDHSELPRIDIYVEKRVLSEFIGDEYYTTIDAETSYEDGEFVGSLLEKLLIFN